MTVVVRYFVISETERQAEVRVEPELVLVPFVATKVVSTVLVSFKEVRGALNLVNEVF